MDLGAFGTLGRALHFVFRVTSANYVEIDHEVLRLTHLEKTLYPVCGFTKSDLLNYYRKMGPTILPHLRDRPVTLKRFPSGVDGESFYEKRCPTHRPGWVRTGDFQDVNYCLINDLPSLIWIANLATIELHTTLARIRKMQCPNAIVFDLDPGEGTGLKECAQIAVLLAGFLGQWKLQAFPKTSGSKGLHLYVPLNGSLTYEYATKFARFSAESLALRLPDQVTAVMSKKVRSGKVFIDWSQNMDFKSTICVYSLRAGNHPTISTPLLWPEVHAASKKQTAAVRLQGLSPQDLFRRLMKQGDIFKPVLELRQDLPSVWVRNVK